MDKQETGTHNTKPYARHVVGTYVFSENSFKYFVFAVVVVVLIRWNRRVQIYRYTSRLRTISLTKKGVVALLIAL